MVPQSQHRRQRLSDFNEVGLVRKIDKGERSIGDMDAQVKFPGTG